VPVCWLTFLMSRWVMSNGPPSWARNGKRQVEMKRPHLAPQHPQVVVLDAGGNDARLLMHEKCSHHNQSRNPILAKLIPGDYNCLRSVFY